MLQFFALFNLENLKQMLRRFSLPVVFVVCIAVVFFLLANLNVSFGSVTMELLQKCAISLILTFFFSV
jgi:hypothetical protein